MSITPMSLRNCDAAGANESLACSAIPVAFSEGSVSRYLQEIRRFPLLSQQEECALARLWRDSGALRHLVRTGAANRSTGLQKASEGNESSG